MASGKTEEKLEFLEQTFKALGIVGMAARRAPVSGWRVKLNVGNARCSLWCEGEGETLRDALMQALTSAGPRDLEDI